MANLLAALDLSFLVLVNENEAIWDLSKSGSFTVESCYHPLLNHGEPQIVGNEYENLSICSCCLLAWEAVLVPYPQHAYLAKKEALSFSKSGLSEH